MLTGRIHPYLPELTIRDYNVYKRYVRGVSYQLYLDYGLLAYQSLPHKAGTLALLSDSLAGRQATCQSIRLPGSLSAVPMMCQTRGIRLAAQIEVLMSWHRLQDRRSSELPLKQKAQRLIQRLTLYRAYRKAVQEEPALERIFCQQRAQAVAQQQLRGQNYAVASEPMSNIYGALFSVLAPTIRSSGRTCGTLAAASARPFICWIRPSATSRTRKRTGTMSLWPTVSARRPPGKMPAARPSHPSTTCPGCTP